MAVEYIGGNSPDGSSFGLTSSEKISFFGATPVVRQSGAALATIAITSATAGGFGTTTSAQFMSIVDQLNAVTSVLKTFGLLTTV
jgi:hypothetical protein